MFSSLSEQMPMGERGQMPAIATRSRPRPTQGACRSGRVEEAYVVLAWVDRDAGLSRAEPAIDADIEAPFLPVPELLGDEGEAVGAERQPWQREFDRGRGANDRGGGNAECAGGAGDAGEPEERTPMECHIAVSY